MDSGLGIADVCDIAVCIVGVFCEIFIPCMERSLPIRLIIVHAALAPASQNLSDDALFLVVRVGQITRTVKVCDGQQITRCIVGEADAVILRISDRCQAAVLVQQRHCISGLVCHFCENSILVCKCQFPAMSASDLCHICVCIILELVLHQTILCDWDKMQIFVIAVSGFIQIQYIIMTVFIHI